MQQAYPLQQGFPQYIPQQQQMQQMPVYAPPPAQFQQQMQQQWQMPSYAPPQPPIQGIQRVPSGGAYNVQRSASDGSSGSLSRTNSGNSLPSLPSLPPFPGFGLHPPPPPPFHAYPPHQFPGFAPYGASPSWGASPLAPHNFFGRAYLPDVTISVKGDPKVGKNAVAKHLREVSGFDEVQSAFGARVSINLAKAEQPPPVQHMFSRTQYVPQPTPAVTVVVFDVTNPESLRDAEHYLKKAGTRVLIANKCDRVEERQVSPDDGHALAGRYSAKYFEVGEDDELGYYRAFEGIVKSVFVSHLQAMIAPEMRAIVSSLVEKMVTDKKEEVGEVSRRLTKSAAKRG